MNRRDRELLDKQFKQVVPASQHNGAIILAMFGLFFAAAILGGTLSPHQAKPMPVVYLTR
jgi:hypothetical protein